MRAYWLLMLPELPEVTVGSDTFGFDPFPVISFTFFHIAFPPSCFSADTPASLPEFNC